MEFTKRQLAFVLAALRTCQTMDLSGMPHFDEETPLSPQEIDDLCETLNTSATGTFTVVGLLPDSEWDGSMRDATFIEQVEAQKPSEAAQTAQVVTARLRIAATDGRDEDEVNQEIEEYASTIEILAVFPGTLPDLYDPSEDPRNYDDHGHD